MTTRLDWHKVSPDSMRALLGAADAVHRSGLEPKLLVLVDLRASQINGCAYCVDMHSKDARALGETEQRLYMLSVWREAQHLYTARERAALAWTEATTRLVDQSVPDDVYELARAEFSDVELARLTLAVGVINAFNRMNVAFRAEAGNYRPGQFKNVRVSGT